MLTLLDYRLIVEQAPIMIWRANVHAKCDFVNQRWLSFTGRTLQEEVGDGWAKGVHADDLERCLRTYHEAFARREAFEMEYRLRRYDGEYRWVLDTGAPMHDPDGRFAGFAGSCVDVTERVEARAALARATLKDLGLTN